MAITAADYGVYTRATSISKSDWECLKNVAGQERTFATHLVLDYGNNDASSEPNHLTNAVASIEAAREAGFDRVEIALYLVRDVKA